MRKLRIFSYVYETTHPPYNLRGELFVRMRLVYPEISEPHAIRPANIRSRSPNNDLEQIRGWLRPKLGGYAKTLALGRCKFPGGNVKYRLKGMAGG